MRPDRTSHVRRTSCVALGTLAALACWSSAQAGAKVRPPPPPATLSVVAGVLTFGYSGNANDVVSISLSAGAYVVTESGDTMIADQGCSTVSPNQASCDAAGVASLSFDTGPGTDTVNVQPSVPVPTTAALGDGSDWFRSGPSDDAIDGGFGEDRVDYAAASGPVAIDLGAGTQTGWGNDTFTGIEKAMGSRYGDTITGGPTKNEIYGQGGNDLIQGLGGDDVIFGGEGNDTLIGGEGNDKLSGEAGNDTIDGTAGEDTALFARARAVSASLMTGTATGEGTDTLLNIDELWGSRGNDTLVGNDEPNVLQGTGGDDILTGNGGDDTLLGQAGADTFDGGDGSDTCDFDPLVDLTSVNCEA